MYIKFGPLLDVAGGLLYAIGYCEPEELCEKSTTGEFKFRLPRIILLQSFLLLCGSISSINFIIFLS